VSARVRGQVRYVDDMALKVGSLLQQGVSKEVIKEMLREQKEQRREQKRMEAEVGAGKAGPSSRPAPAGFCARARRGLPVPACC
jgi:hypothetical protein